MDSTKKPLIFKPSFKNYRQWFVRRLLLVLPLVLLLLFQVWIMSGRDSIKVLTIMAIVFGVTALLIILFFLRARIMVDGNELTYRGLLFQRSIQITDVEATYLEIDRPVASVNGSNAVLVVANKQHQIFKRISEGFWTRDDLRSIAKSLHADIVTSSSERGKTLLANQGPKTKWITEHLGLFILITFGASFIFIVLIVVIANLFNRF